MLSLFNGFLRCFTTFGHLHKFGTQKLCIMNMKKSKLRYETKNPTLNIIYII